MSLVTICREQMRYVIGHIVVWYTRGMSLVTLLSYTAVEDHWLPVFRIRICTRIRIDFGRLDPGSGKVKKTKKS
jgi:hypothetical protein